MMTAVLLCKPEAGDTVVSRRADPPAVEQLRSVNPEKQLHTLPLQTPWPEQEFGQPEAAPEECPLLLLLREAVVAETGMSQLPGRPERQLQTPELHEPRPLQSSGQPGITWYRVCADASVWELANMT